MTREERVEWAKTATEHQWSVACATLVMGWHEHRGAWLDDKDNIPALVYDGFAGGGEPIAAWNPSKNPAHAWMIKEKMRQSEDRLFYLARLVALSGPHPSLDMQPRDICLAALLTVESESK